MRQCQHVTDVSLSARVKQMFQHLPIRSIGSGNAAISNLLLSGDAFKRHRNRTDFVFINTPPSLANRPNCEAEAGRQTCER